MSSKNVKGLESLQVWQKAMDFAVLVCKEILPGFPTEEKYALTDQLRRSVQSIPANIAEGHGRYYYQEGVRFSYMARGSLAEVYNHICFAEKMGYIPESKLRACKDTIYEINRMLSGYITFLKESKRGASEHNASIHELGSEYDINLEEFSEPGSS